MSLFDNKPILTNKRKGDSTDPFISISESHQIENSKVVLSEIPDDFTKVSVIGGGITWYEKSSGIPSANEYVVDYNSNIVTFDSSRNGLQLQFDFKGTGMHYVPTSMIYTQVDNNNNVVETLKNIVDDGRAAIDAYGGITKAISDAQTETTTLNNTISSANTTNTNLGSTITNANTANTTLSNTTTNANTANDTLTGTVNTANTSISELNQTNDSFKLLEPYDNTHSYITMNKVYYNGSTYQNILACTGIVPTNTTYWQIVAQKGADGTGSGDMSKSTYDSNSDGVVNDSDRLGGQLPSYYAPQSGIPTQLSQLTDDSTHRLVTDNDKNNWNGKQNPATTLVGYGITDATSLAQTNSMVINVKYPPSPLVGTIGDGTTDDTTPIQSAINMASSNGGGTVYVPKGQYKITSSLILKDNVSIMGEGDNITIFLNNTTVECMKYIGTSEAPRVGIILSNFWIKGGTGVNEIGIRFRNACGYKLEHVVISEQSIGIRLAYGNRIGIEDCTIFDNKSRGLLLGGDTGIASTPYLDGITIENCGFSGNLYHIEHLGSGSTASAEIIGNYFYSYAPTVSSIWLTQTKGIHIAGNWFEQGSNTKGIVLNVTSIDGTTYATPYGTSIISNCFASQGSIYIDVIEGSATVIEGNSFIGPSVGCIHVSTGAGRTQVGVNKYENLGMAYAVSATYLNLLDTSDKSLIAGRIKQQRAGTVSITADGTNGYVSVAFETAPTDWTKVACIATWNSTTLSDYTSAPTQISWTQLDSLYVRFKVAGKSSGNISYVITESN